MASSMEPRSARARSREVERHSPDSQQVPGTTFVAPSHSMTPTLDVVCAEMRPKGIWQTACGRHGKRRDAALGLYAGVRGFSAEGRGERAVARRLIDDGARIAVGIQARSRAFHPEGTTSSSAPAPSRCISSHVVKIDMHIGKRLRRFDEAAQLPRRLRPRPPCRQPTGWYRPRCGSRRLPPRARCRLHGRTVSICPHSATAPGALPARNAIRLPVSEPVWTAESSIRTVNPRSSSSALQRFAIDGLMARWAVDAGKFAEQFEQRGRASQAPLSVSMSANRDAGSPGYAESRARGGFPKRVAYK